MNLDKSQIASAHFILPSGEKVPVSLDTLTVTLDPLTVDYDKEALKAAVNSFTMPKSFSGTYKGTGIFAGRGKANRKKKLRTKRNRTKN